MQRMFTFKGREMDSGMENSICNKINEKKIIANSTQCSQAVTDPSTDWAQRCLTSVIGREPVLST